MAKHRFVVDTIGVISFFQDVFHLPSRISQSTLDILYNGINYDSDVLLTIPSIVFVEIFDKWFRGNEDKCKEFRAKFIYEVLFPLKSANNVEIRGMDFEILEGYLRINDSIVNLDNHDKIILATSIILNANLITSDAKVIKYVKYDKCIPRICN